MLNPISAFAQNPLRIEERVKRVSDGVGGLVERSASFPVWFEPIANGATPMQAALKEAAQVLATWCDSHPDSYPPTVLHVTDGESTDGDPEGVAEALRQFQTNDGNVLLLNLHVSARSSQPISFPSSDSGLVDQFAKMLYRMSSPMPPHLVKEAQKAGHTVSSESRGYVFNADAVEVVDFFDIGTRPTDLR